VRVAVHFAWGGHDSLRLGLKTRYVQNTYTTISFREELVDTSMRYLVSVGSGNVGTEGGNNKVRLVRLQQNKTEIIFESIVYSAA
jgi:hypothetical protein